MRKISAPVRPVGVWLYNATRYALVAALFGCMFLGVSADMTAVSKWLASLF